MDQGSDLYTQARDDLQAIVGPLFEFAEQQVQKRNAFLPFGASLDSKGVSMAAADIGSDRATSEEVLPLLHDGLRSVRPDTRAIAVCEWVTITPADGSPTDAIKVLVEHANGLTVAFCLPMRKKTLGKWQSGEMISVAADPEVKPW